MTAPPRDHRKASHDRLPSAWPIPVRGIPAGLPGRRPHRPCAHGRPVHPAHPRLRRDSHRLRRPPRPARRRLGTTAAPCRCCSATATRSASSPPPPPAPPRIPRRPPGKPAPARTQPAGALRRPGSIRAGEASTRLRVRTARSGRPQMGEDDPGGTPWRAATIAALSTASATRSRPAGRQVGGPADIISGSLQWAAIPAAPALFRGRA